MHNETIPVSLEEFLHEPQAQMREFAPASMIYAPGGTKRSAIYQGIEPWSKQYVEWGLAQTFDCLELLFSYGIENIFLPVFMSVHIQEFAEQQARLFAVIAEHLAGPAAVEYYKQRRWQVRLLGNTEHIALQQAHQTLESETDSNAPCKLWLMGSLGIEAYWNSLLTRLIACQAQTRAEAIRAIYGMDVPPISMLIGFGKPTVTPEMYPPLLQGDIQCYWSQQVGYSLTEKQLRMILYDYAFLRKTWQQDKATRAAAAETDRALWESEFILGLGRRIGPFWYPDMQGYPTDVLPGEREA